MLEDSIYFVMVTLHLVLQCKDIEEMKSTTSLLEVGETLPCSYQYVVGLVPLDFVDPIVFDNSEDDFICFAFHGFISGEVSNAGLVDGLLPWSHRCLFVVPDGCIIDGRISGGGNVAV